MRVSDRYKQDAREMFGTGIVFLVIGFLWLLSITSLYLWGVKMNVGPFFAAVPCLIFFGASMWAFFVEYPYEKRLQQTTEEEEAQEEVERRKQLEKN